MQYDMAHMLNVSTLALFPVFASLRTICVRVVCQSVSIRRSTTSHQIDDIIYCYACFRTSAQLLLHLTIMFECIANCTAVELPSIYTRSFCEIYSVCVRAAYTRWMLHSESGIYGGYVCITFAHITREFDARVRIPCAAKITVPTNWAEKSC